FRPGPSMAAMAMARMSVGKLKSTSMTRPIARSGHPPTYPPMRPSAVPATKAMAMLETATPRAMRLPWTVRLSTSRPKRSVPKGGARDGAVRASDALIRVGAWGARAPASAASSTMAATIPVPKSTSRFRSAGRRARRQSDAASAIPDARVDPRVDQVDQEVGDHEERADEQDGPLDERVVPLEDAPQEESPDAGQREDLLGDDHAAQQVADLDARHRDERDQAVLERVAPQDAGLRQPLGARRPDVVL